MADIAPSTDLYLVFQHAPVGLLVSRQRVIQTYNMAFSEMFGYRGKELEGRSVECLYPSHDEFAHVGERALASMRETGRYSDERIMRHASGRLFWCHVSGSAIERNDPFAAAVWMFEDISAKRPVSRELTPREREIAQLLITGQTSKQIARALRISHRTVEGHRARLMHKLAVSTPGEMIARLVGLDVPV